MAEDRTTEAAAPERDGTDHILDELVTHLRDERSTLRQEWRDGSPTRRCCR